MKTIKFIKLLFCIFLLVCLFSCGKTEDVIINQTVENSAIKYIKSLGYEQSDIVEYNDKYIVQGDILFSKDANYNLQIGGLKQASIAPNCLVTYENRDIKIYFNPSDFPIIGANLSTALDGVISAYNSSGSYLYFSRTSNSSDFDIEINNYNLETNTCGLADLPSGYGQPGSMIFIDEGEFSSNYNSYGYLFTILAHELGHTVGLHHTNWRSYTYQAGDYAPRDISGTPSSDVNSVMNQGTCGISFTNLSSYDVIALKTLYPFLSMRIIGSDFSPCFSCGTWNAIVVNGKSQITTYLWNYKIYKNGVLSSTGSSTNASLQICINYKAKIVLSLHVDNGPEHANDTRTLYQCE
jgi:hypothetical protein